MMFLFFIASAFAACTCKKETVSNLVTLSVTCAAGDVFSSCDNNINNYDDIQKIVFDNNLKELSQNAFQSVPKLQEMTFGTALEKIGENCFQNIGGNVDTKQNNYKFELVIPANVKSIGNNVGQNSKSVTHLVLKGNQDLTIGDQFFHGAENLKEVTIEGKVKSIGNNFCQNAGQVEKLTIKGDIGSIGNEFFQGAKGLKEITIEATIGKCGTNPFQNADKLEKITYTGNSVECPSTLHPTWPKNAKIDMKNPICGFKGYNGAMQLTILFVCSLLFFLL